MGLTRATVGSCGLCMDHRLWVIYGSTSYAGLSFNDSGFDVPGLTCDPFPHIND